MVLVMSESLFERIVRISEEQNISRQEAMRIANAEVRIEEEKAKRNRQPGILS